MTREQLERICDGCALLESSTGNLYEYVGFRNGRYIFQNVSDDSHIEARMESLIGGSDFNCVD